MNCTSASVARAVGRVLGGERDAVGRGVDRAHRGRDRAHVVAPVGARAPQPPDVVARRLDERERLVAGDRPRVGTRQRRRALGRGRHEQQVRLGSRADGCAGAVW